MAHIDKYSGITLLDKEDKLIIKEGMDIYCYLPAMYFNKEQPFSLNEDWFPITVGTTYKRVINKEEIAKSISKAFYNQISPNHIKITEFINSVISSKSIDISSKTLTTSHLIGKYKVVSTIYETTDGKNCYYKVCCTNENNPAIKIKFYQTTAKHSYRFATYNDLEILN